MECLETTSLNFSRMTGHSETIEFVVLRATHRSTAGPHETELKNLVTTDKITGPLTATFLFSWFVVVRRTMSYS